MKHPVFKTDQNDLFCIVQNPETDIKKVRGKTFAFLPKRSIKVVRVYDQKLAQELNEAFYIDDHQLAILKDKSNHIEAECPEIHQRANRLIDDIFYKFIYFDYDDTKNTLTVYHITTLPMLKPRYYDSMWS